VQPTAVRDDARLVLPNAYLEPDSVIGGTDRCRASEDRGKAEERHEREGCRKDGAPAAAGTVPPAM
ncbi:MAG: hypothetical protein KC729_18970, partial [Candidatus Eisenbacteria bacterium]|nr:hypothetical protein [Candidatus Eisenbacteria bacterium]